LITACFVAARRLSGLKATLSLAAGISMPLLIGLGMASVVAAGVAFFVAAIVGWTWLAALILQLADPSTAEAATILQSQASPKESLDVL